MATFFRMVGIAALSKVLKDSVKEARTPGEYWVGSAVPYGPFHEFGTGSLAERPHWRPSLLKVAQNHGLRSGGGDDLVNAMIATPRGLVKKIAFEIEREVKISITRQNIIDTGNYKGSIATGPTETEAFATSAAKSTV